MTTKVAHHDIDWGPLVKWGLIGIAAWYIWSKINPFSPSSPVGQGLNTIEQSAADFWNSLTMSGPINVLGSVDLPTGQAVAISSLTWKTDSAGNTYTNLNGTVYQLAARGADGNFTLQPYGGAVTASTGTTGNTGATTFQ